MSAYFELLMNGKLEEAEKVRLCSIPKKLIKFVSLTDNEERNCSKFATLRDQEIWFSSVDELNDPYEYQCIYVNREKLKELGCSTEIIERFQEMLIKNQKEYAVSSLSANSYNCLPMWAYYANDHRGFCVEYEVAKPYAIHKISYEANRIPVAVLLANLVNEYASMRKSGRSKSVEAQKYLSLLSQQFFLKHNSWSHENEYRIIYPFTTGNGISVPINTVGLKTSHIYAGTKCAVKNVEKLSEISNYINCGSVKQLCISENNYTLLEDINNG